MRLKGLSWCKVKKYFGNLCHAWWLHHWAGSLRSTHKQNLFWSVFMERAGGNTQGQVLEITPLALKKLAPATHAIELAALSFYHLSHFEWMVMNPHWACLETGCGQINPGGVGVVWSVFSWAVFSELYDRARMYEPAVVCTSCNGVSSIS